LDGVLSPDEALPAMMPAHIRQLRCLTSSRLGSVLALVCALLLAPLLYGTSTPPAGVLPSGPPAWWAARGIAELLAGSATATVSEAQLYQVALAARAELDAKLPTGAGAAITAEVAGWLNAPVPGLRGEYFSNLTLSGTLALERQESPDFNWDGWGNLPPAGLAMGAFSARWSGELEVPTAGNYVFEADGVGGVRLWVNGTLVLDVWDGPANQSNGGRAVVPLAANTPASIRLEYRSLPPAGWAGVHLRWSQQPTTFRAPGVMLHAQYFDSTDFSGEPVVERDEIADFRWGADAPDPALTPGQFSARWTGTFVVRPDQLGPGTSAELGPVWVDFNLFNSVAALSDGQVRIWIDGELLLDAAHPGFNAQGQPNGEGFIGGRVPFNSGYPHTVVIEYAAGGGSDAFLRWGLLADLASAYFAGPDLPLNWDYYSTFGTALGANGYAMNAPEDIAPAGGGWPPSGASTARPAQYVFDDGTVLERTDAAVAFNWGTLSPDSTVPPELGFTAYWSGAFTDVPSGQIYGENVRVWLGGGLALDGTGLVDLPGGGVVGAPAFIAYRRAPGVVAGVARWDTDAPAASGVAGPGTPTGTQTSWARNLAGAATRAQLRAIANLFRTRLAALGYRGLTELATGDETAAMTIGELRELFNFDLDWDSDLDGKTFAQELLAGTNPYDWFDGQAHWLVKIQGDDQVGPPGAFLPKPLTVRMVGPNGRIWVNAPVIFTLPADDPGFLSADGEETSPLVKTLVVYTDGLGFAGAYLKQ
jgi:hypothetical protein